MNKISDGFENMSKKTKMVLTLVGISAVVVPAVLLLVVSSVNKKDPVVSTSARTVDADSVTKNAKSVPTPKIVPTSTPKASTSSAKPNESSSSSR